MKVLITFVFFLISQAYAQDICQYNDVSEFIDSIEQSGGSMVKSSDNVKRFTFLEKEMTHLTVTLQDWRRGVSRDEALEDFHRGEGRVEYYNFNGKKYALVHYWPGDNQYGGFFELIGKSYKLIAGIFDGFVECK